MAQEGKRYNKVKPFKGCGTGVCELVTEYNGNAYRAIYTVEIKDTIYVVHCFQKKSKQGIKTPREEVNIIKTRLKLLRAELNKK